MSRIFTGLGLTLASAVVLAGCSFSTDSAPQNGSSNADGGASGAPPGTSTPGDTSSGGTAPSGKLSFAPANVAPDASLTANGDWIFNSDTCSGTQVTIDTAKGEVSCGGQATGSFVFQAITQTDQTYGTMTAGLFVTRRLVIESNMVVDVIGNRPLVIVSLSTVSIQGTLRAAASFQDAFRSNGGGFDGNQNAQKGFGPGGGSPGVAGTGAGGGGHCGVGGAGVAAAGGVAYGRPTGTPLLGGSAGGSSPYGEGGAGGGALQISAAVSIEIGGTGVLDVSGGGGSNGKGGGGAGGAILLEAPAVSVYGTVAANGGGGASGDVYLDGTHGFASAAPAPGGAGGAGAGAGGAGSAGAITNGLDGVQIDADHAQGGGGGGAGWIRINTKSGSAMIGASAVISPSLSTACATQGTSATH